MRPTIVIAIDVVGAPVEGGRKRLTGIELVFGASQLMMQSIIAMKLKHHARRQSFIRPPVSGFRALDFLKIDAVLAETAAIKDELKHAIDALLVGERRRERLRNTVLRIGAALHVLYLLQFRTENRLAAAPELL